MNVELIIDSLKQERNRIDAAIAALSGSRSGRGRAASGGSGHRPMSAQAKARIAAGQRARWARVRAAKKKK